MIIIGERINSSRSQIAKAIGERNTDFIAHEAKLQADLGAQYLDVNCAAGLDKEIKDLEWVIKTIRKATTAPICLDSPNLEALEAGVSLLAGEPVFINSITAEPDKLNQIIPLLKKRDDLRVIALTLDERGVPKTVLERIENGQKIIEFFKKQDINPEGLFFDFLVQPLSTQQEQAAIFLEALKEAKQLGWNTVCGLSNISFGLPRRTVLNAAFLVSAVASGLDAAIIDPTDSVMTEMLAAMEVILSRDNYCLNYIKKMKRKNI
ncbi:MAG: dihydropteroate synthase [Candidatus Omnitrophota bacterium]